MTNAQPSGSKLDWTRAEIANHPWTFILGFMLGVIASLVFLIAVLALDYISRGA